MAATDTDVIDALSGIQPGSPLDIVRARRPQARAQAEAAYRALFEPEAPGGVTAQERFAVASFVASLHGQTTIAAFYARGLADASAGQRAAVEGESARGATAGPYGNYPPGRLSAENTAGPVYRVTAANRQVLGPRLAAAFEHVHLLVFHPRDATAQALQALLDAGWSTSDIVTLSQLVAFLTFQIRTIAGLSVLASHR